MGMNHDYLYPTSQSDVFEYVRKPINEWLLEYTKIINSYPIKEKTIKNRLSNLKWISEVIGDKPIGLIKPYEIALELKLVHSKTPAKARRLLIEIKNMFTEAIIYGWIDRNPSAHLKSFSAPVARERLTLPEWNILLDKSRTQQNTWVPFMLQLALITGQRRADLFKMKYSDISDNNLLVTQQKSGNKIAIPLGLKLFPLNKSLGELISETKSYGNLSDNILRKRNGSEIALATGSQVFTKLVSTTLKKNTTLHECRSLSERLYRSQGINTRLLLGHKRQDTTDRYNDIRGINRDTYTIITL